MDSTRWMYCCPRNSRAAGLSISRSLPVESRLMSSILLFSKHRSARQGNLRPAPTDQQLRLLANHIWNSINPQIEQVVQSLRTILLLTALLAFFGSAAFLAGAPIAHADGFERILKIFAGRGLT